METKIKGARKNARGRKRLGNARRSAIRMRAMVVGVVANQTEAKELWAHRDHQLKSRQKQGKVAMKSATKKEERKKGNA